MNEFINEYVIQKSNAVRVQFFRYLWVGALATIADTGVFFVFDNIFNLHYLIAQTAGFLLGLIVNYALSVLWVFQSTGNVKKEFTIFASVGVGGLVLSYLILWLLIDLWGLDYFQDMLAKGVAITVVLFWNFGMRRRFAFALKQ